MNPMSWKSSSGEFRLDRSANSSIRRRSSRRWSEVSTSGTASEINPGLTPVLWIDAPPLAHAASTRWRRAGSMLGGMVQFAAGGNHVDSRPEQRADHLGIEPLLHEQDAVGPQGLDLLKVRGGDNAGPIEPAQVTGIPARLVCRAHPHAGQLELGMLEHGPQRAGPDVSGGPLDHPVLGHRHHRGSLRARPGEDRPPAATAAVRRPGTDLPLIGSVCALVRRLSPRTGRGSAPPRHASRHDRWSCRGHPPSPESGRRR